MPRPVLAALAALLILATPTAAQEPPRLIVGVRAAPPFVIKDTDGGWKGISIDLWKQIAAERGLRYEFREFPLPELLKGLESGEIDVGVAALTVTAEREKRFDFTHPFHHSGLGIAVPYRPSGGWRGLIDRLFSSELGEILLGLLALLMVTGGLIWLLERRRNPQFQGTAGRGIGAGVWWSAVTMTTVGYGDKAPVTPGGRLMAAAWMFTSVVLFSVFTATIASLLTVDRLESTIRRPSDLLGRRVATVRGSTSDAFLKELKIEPALFGELDEALTAVLIGEAEAAVYDAPLLRYQSKRRFKERIQVVTGSFRREDYAFGLKGGSPLREDLNDRILRKIGTEDWEALLELYLGDR